MVAITGLRRAVLRPPAIVGTAVALVALWGATAKACTITTRTETSGGCTWVEDQSCYVVGYYREAAEGGYYYTSVGSGIVVKEPYIPSDDTAAYSYAWVMLNETTGNGVAQVGPIREYSSGSGGIARFNFGACYYSDGTLAFNHWWSPSNPDNTVTYTVFADQTGEIGPAGDKYFVIDGVQQTQSCSATWSPSEAQIAGEIHDRKSQVPGSVSDPENFTNATLIRSDGYTTYFFNGDEALGSFIPDAGGGGNGNIPGWFEHGFDDVAHTGYVNDGDCP